MSNDCASGDAGHTIAIQVGNQRPRVHRDLTLEECREVAGRVDPGVLERLKRGERQLTAIHQKVTADPNLAVEYYLMQRAQSQVDELLSCDLTDFPGQEQGHRVERYHEFGLHGSALLYRDVGFSGKSKFFTATWPNFKWWPYKFNDQASSAKSWGVCILFERSWYKGRRLNLIGLPYAEFENLHDFDFGDIASSILCVP